MPSIVTGVPSTVTTPLVRTVTAASNASPIVITTSAAHQFVTGDTVVIQNVGGNTAANGVWQITKTSSTQFQLDSSTGNAAYTSGGTATNLSLTPQFQIPDDGDDLDAASVNVALEALSDRSQFLGLQLGSIPDITSLKTVDVSSLTVGTKRFVSNQGLFELAPDVLGTEDLPWAVLPNGGGSNVWRAAVPFKTTRTLLVPLAGMQEISSNGAGAAASETRASYAGNRAKLGTAHGNFTAAAFKALQVDVTAGKSYYYAMCLDPYMVDGGSLLQATLIYQPTGGHGALPGLFPGMRIEYADYAYTQGTLGAFAYDTAASVGAYEVLRNFVWTPSIVPFPITKQYRSYRLVVADEGGANALAVNFSSLKLEFSNINDARPQ